MTLKKLLAISIAVLAFLQGYAQQKDISALDTGTITNYSAYKRSLSFAGLLQTRYLASVTKNVDVNGKQFDPAASTKGITNSFLIKRARLQVKANVNDHFSANFMINFAEFNTEPANKVLENAYIKYSLNKYFNIQAGQFRPFFGIEDAMPVDIIRTLDYSNQYYAFGSNGWQSFQIGVSIYGNITKEDDDLPMRYYTGVYNGNNRNQALDNDNSKNAYARIEADLNKTTTIGLNAAIGSQGSGTGNAIGADIITRFSLSTKWKLLLGGEFKNGTSFTTYKADTATSKPGLSQYRMQGFYVFPILRYEPKRPRIRALELSSRYEYFDETYKQNSNPRQTIIPNFTWIFADNLYAALQMGVAIDLYKNKVPLTTVNNHGLAYVQLQVRF
ncbi:porin [Deminuibacter soli]|uniref:Porin n=1 Tax=Deminuibacter soli TaxID=2291815 RepID=A0A3E1NF29_9BACT|nr:porin [Deminuibacter soli]RFM26388.1 porin [Deminuibacter soli]